MQECDISSTIAEHDFHVDPPQVEPLKRQRRSRWACFQVSASGITTAMTLQEPGLPDVAGVTHRWPVFGHRSASGPSSRGIVHPFQRATLARAAQSWRGGYQFALSAPVVAAAATLRVSPRPVAAAIRAGTNRRRLH